MKLKNGVVTDQFDKDQYVAVATGEAAKYFNGMIRHNKTSAFLLDLLRTEQTETSLVKALLEKYDITEEIAYKDVKSFINNLREADLIDG